MQKIIQSLQVYKSQLDQGDIQTAYRYLIRYVMHLKAHFSKSFPYSFSFGNVSEGYMDFTYFPFTDKFLKDRKLRFGIVLNHQDLRFELWLMGQNAEVQNQYWKLLKTSPWNEKRTEMPQYSVLETILVMAPDFENPTQLANLIQKEALANSEAILTWLQKLEG